MTPSATRRPGSARIGLVLLLLAVAAAAALRRGPVADAVLRAQVGRRVAHGDLGAAEAGAARLASRTGDAADAVELAVIRLRDGRVASVAAPLDRAATLEPDSATRARGLQVRSALHLIRADVTGTRTPAPGRLALPGVDRDADLRAAAVAARDAIRFGAGAGAAWNLWLAVRDEPVSGSPTAGSPPSSASSAIVRRGLASAEARALKEALPDILRALASNDRASPRRGPPW